MDLDHLKQQMNRQLEKDTDWRPPEDTAAIIRKRSDFIIAKIKSSLWLEVMIGLFINIPLAIYLAYKFPRIFSMSPIWIYILLLIATAPILGYVLIKTRWLEKRVGSVRDQIKSIHQLITYYCQVNLILSIALAPVGYCIGLAISLPEQRAFSLDYFFDYYFSNPAIISVLLIGIFITELTMLMLVRWYLRFFYGKYLDKLREMLKELDNG